MRQAQEETINKFVYHLHINDIVYQDDERSGVVYREWSKGPNTLPCEPPYSNKLGCDLILKLQHLEIEQSRMKIAN